MFGRGPSTFMHEDKQRAPQTAGRSAKHADQRSAISSRFEQFEKRQRELWQFTFAVLFALAVFFAWTSWASIRSFANRYEALPPVLLVVVIALFGTYMWKKTQEISELRGLMRGMEHRDEAPPSDKQLDHFAPSTAVFPILSARLSTKLSAGPSVISCRRVAGRVPSFCSARCPGSWNAANGPGSSRCG